MKKILSILLILISINTAFTQEIDNFYAQDIAKKYLYSKLISDTANYQIGYTEIVSYQKHASYYVVNFKPTGFVILSAYKFYEPILAYSTENNFQIYDMPDNLRYWMHQYDFVIDLLYKYNPSNQQYMEKWNYYENLNFQKRDTEAGFWLLTSEWNQSRNNSNKWQCGNLQDTLYGAYNKFVPEDNDDCHCGKCKAGCTAIAMAQIINYWRYPLYSSKRMYDWANIEDALFNTSSYEEIDATAHLIADCADFINSNYCNGGCATTSVLIRARNSLMDDFNYDKSASFKKKINTDNWCEKLREDLDKGFPILYAGKNPENGASHAFVCDGYDYDDDNIFHLNRGTGNIGDFYHIDNENPFSKWQMAVFHIKPELYFGCTEEIDLGEFWTNNYTYWPMHAIPLAGTILTATKDYSVDYRTVYSGEYITIQAYNRIVLRQGFHVEQGAHFHAYLTDCPETKNTTKNIQHKKTQPTNNQVQQQTQLHLSPNPFKYSVSISYKIPTETNCEISIYNMYGQLQKTIVNKKQTAGTHQIYSNLSDLSVGVYLCVFKTNSGVITQKIIKAD